MPSTALASNPFLPGDPGDQPDATGERHVQVLDLDHVVAGRGPPSGVVVSVALTPAPSPPARVRVPPAGRRPCGPGRPRTARARASGIRRTPPGSEGGTEHPDGIFWGSGGSPPRPVGFRRKRVIADLGERVPRAPSCTGASGRRRPRGRPSSTILPAYMIARRSETSTSTDRSCVMKIIDSPRSRCRVASCSCRTCACTMTSSAVVGSSAITSDGLHASAIAIITRCFWPPDSSCG